MLPGDPVASGPVVPDPVASGPVDAAVAVGPVAADPVAIDPVAGGPVAGGPVAGGPVAGGRVAGGRVAGGRVAADPVAVWPVDAAVAVGPVANDPVACGPVGGGRVAADPVAVGPVDAAAGAEVPVPVVDPAAGRRAVWRLAGARLASTGGSQAAQVALAYTVYEQTSSPAWVSASLVASVGVVGLFGPVSGRLSDRRDRRRVMVVAEVAGGVGWLLVLLAGSPLALVLAALAATAANAPFRAASSAAVPNLVGPDQLAWANSVMSTAFNTSLLVGPLVGGVLVGAVGPGSVFGLNAASFLISAVVIARLPGRFAEARPAADGIATPRTSWRRLAADRRRRRLFAVTTLAFAAFGITLVADLPLVDRFGGGSVAYALLTTLWGAGAVAGSVLAARLPRRHEPTALVGGAAAMGLSLGALAVAPNLPLAIAVGVVGGAGDGVLFAPWYSMMQRRTPDTERGTAFAMADTLDQTAFVAGMVVAGALVETIGVQATYLFPGTLMIGAAFLARGVD
jgi:MFS family permease